MRKDSFIETIISGKILVSDKTYFWLPAFLLFHYLFPQKMRKNIPTNLTPFFSNSKRLISNDDKGKWLF